MQNNPPAEEKYQNTHKQIFSALREKHNIHAGVSIMLSMTTKAALFIGALAMFDNDKDNHGLWLPISLSVIQDIFSDISEILSHIGVEKARNQLVIDSEQLLDQQNVEAVPLLDLDDDIKGYKDLAKIGYRSAILPIGAAAITDIVLSLKNVKHPINDWILYTSGAYMLFRGLANSGKALLLQNSRDDYQDRLDSLSRNQQQQISENPNAILPNQDEGRDVEYGSFRP